MLKIYVYAISKNEEKFIDRWYSSMKEADDIYVLDTGSSDDTIKKLKKHKVHVKQEIIDPWRFDVARNKSLDMVPLDADICVCTDLDEVFKPGWRKELEKVWKKNTNRCRYIYNWSIDENNKPIVSFYYEKIHSRKGYKWVHPVHEILKTRKKENYVTTDKIVLNHYPDNNKSRGSYLPLLELSVKEDPNNDRNLHYLGREYMYYGRWNEAIDTLMKHLSSKQATWKDERCASMRFIARCYQNLNCIKEARTWLNKAIDEAPYLRDPYVEMALLEYNQENWKQVEINCLKALSIKEHQKTYINEVFSWDETPYDLLSISYYYQNRIKEAISNLELAIKIKPDNERLLKNLEFMKDKLG